MIDPNGFQRSRDVSKKLQYLIPGGAHTYAKGDDQYPEGLAPVIAYGRGAHVFDVDDNEYVEYGSGLRAVSLGHAHPRVLAAVRAELDKGNNFARPAAIELEAAEAFLGCVPTADMVKFAKNGSDATDAAVKLARAVTGRDRVALCRDGSFFSTGDWYITQTPMNRGIPQAIDELTLTFDYGDLAGTGHLLEQHGSEIACLVLQAASATEPPPGYLAEVVELAHRHGALVVFDEMITGFRWSEAGAQGVYGVRPDLSTFGKAMGNGFAVSALAGRREIMELGGFNHPRERVFLLSTTHGAETHALAAMLAVIETYRIEGTIARLEELGERLAAGVQEVAVAAGVGDFVTTAGRSSNLVFVTRGPDGKPSQHYRTLFMRELLLGGVLAPSFVVSSAMSDADIDHTIDVVAGACRVYRTALDTGDPTPWLHGRPVQPAFRKFG